MDLSPSGWGRVILGTMLGTLGCIAAAVFVDSFNFPNLDSASLRWSLTLDILLPTGLAGSILFFLLSKLRELAIAHEQLRRHAATDTLTTLLNRNAFTEIVEEHMADAAFTDSGLRGALFVIDADNFKSINDTFGHEIGDEALRVIGRAIRGVLRANDCAGRIGGEEFAVFFPSMSPITAEAVADRLRLAVHDAPFAPGGVRHHLTVSVGGAIFDRPLGFSELFRLADQQLYVAKQNGRNCIAVSPIAVSTDLSEVAA